MAIEITRSPAIYVPGYGPSSAKLMIVGEAPGEEEEKHRKPFVGPSGQIAADIAKQAGFDWSECYRANVFPWRPPLNDFKRIEETGHTLEEGIADLKRQIDAIKPNAILALGAVAFANLVPGKRNLNLCRGSIYHAFDGKTKVVATHHPARLLPSANIAKMLPFSTRFIMRHDFKRAWDESKTSTLELPKRHLQVAKNSLDVYRYLLEYETNTLFSADIESIRSIPVCLGLAANSYHGICIPLIDVPGKFSLPIHEKLEIFRLLAAFFRRPGLQLIGQNWKFDHDKLEPACRFVLPDPYFDTSLAFHCLFPEFPKGLNFITSICTREPYYKDELKEFDLKRDNINDLFLYNAKDVAVPFEIYEVLSKELHQAGLYDYFQQFYMPLHRLYIDMERTGFVVDETVRQRLRTKYDSLELEIQCKLDTICGFDLNVNSPKQVALALYGPNSVGKFPIRKGADEETLSQLYANHAKSQLQKDLIDNILSRRQVGKTKSTYVNFRKDYDGRCRTSFQICGTETFRGSTQLLKPPTRPRKIGLTFHNITSHSDIGADLKSMLCAPEGCVIGNADLSQAEPRIVAILSEDWELIEKFGKIDVHKESAGICFDIRPLDKAQEMGKEDPKRFIGKTAKNATNYDAGKKRLALTINTDAKKYGIPNVQVSEWLAGQMLDKLHKAYPKLRGVFHREIQKHIEKTRTLFDPFGGRRIFMGRMDHDLYKEAYAHIPQRTVITQLRQAALRIKARLGATIHFVNEHHDALAWFSPIDQFAAHAAIVREEMMKPINFSKCSLSRNYDLIIPSDVEYGFNYGAYHSERNPKGMRKFKGEIVV